MGSCEQISIAACRESDQDPPTLFDSPCGRKPPPPPKDRAETGLHSQLETWGFCPAAPTPHVQNRAKVFFSSKLLGKKKRGWAEIAAEHTLKKKTADVCICVEGELSASQPLPARAGPAWGGWRGALPPGRVRKSPGVGATKAEAEAKKINKRGGLMAVIITIMAFIWLPNESDHRQREKLSIAQALMNFFANCNQARPSQLAD